MKISGTQVLARLTLQILCWVWTLALKLAIPRALHCTPADFSWWKHNMTKGAEVCTWLTAHRGCLQSTRSKSYYPKDNHQRSFLSDNKDCTCDCCRTAEKEQRFFFINLVICVTCSSCLQGHVRPSLFPNLRTKPRRFQTLNSKKETRVHQSFCSMDVLSYWGHLSCLRNTSSGAGDCLSRAQTIDISWNHSKTMEKPVRV